MTAALFQITATGKKPAQAKRFWVRDGQHLQSALFPFCLRLTVNVEYYFLTDLSDDRLYNLQYFEKEIGPFLMSIVAISQTRQAVLVQVEPLKKKEHIQCLAVK